MKLALSSDIQPSKAVLGGGCIQTASEQSRSKGGCICSYIPPGHAVRWKRIIQSLPADVWPSVTQFTWPSSLPLAPAPPREERRDEQQSNLTWFLPLMQLVLVAFVLSHRWHEGKEPVPPLCCVKKRRPLLHATDSKCGKPKRSEFQDCQWQVMLSHPNDVGMMHCTLCLSVGSPDLSPRISF